MTEKVLEGIRGAANTDQIGDGKIFVLDLGQAVRIEQASPVLKHYKWSKIMKKKILIYGLFCLVGGISTVTVTATASWRSLQQKQLLFLIRCLFLCTGSS